MRFGTPSKRWLLVALLTLGAGQVNAQESTRHYGSGQISLVRVAFSGGDFRKTPSECSNCRMVDPGLGFDLAAVIPAAPPLILAGGVQYSRHKTESELGKLGILQLYLEPRFVIRQSGKFTPYLWGRVAFIHASQEMALVDDFGVDVFGNGVQTGPGFGAGAGLLIQATSHIRVSLAAGVNRISLGNIDFDYQKVAASSAKGMNILIRAGVAFEFSPTSPAGLRTGLGW